MAARPVLCILLAALLASSTSAQSSDHPGRKLAIYFPTVHRYAGKSFSTVTIVLSCAHVAAITRIPDDWYLETLLPAHRDDPEWKPFWSSTQALVLGAGHGVSRLDSLAELNGAVQIAVEDAACLDVTVIVEDDMGDDGWPATTLKMKDLRLK